MEFLRKLLNGALGESTPGDFERIPIEDEVFPENGILVAPIFRDEYAPAQRGLYLGPEFRSLINVGDSIVGGQPIAEVETSQMIVEVTSTCSGTIESVLANNGEVIQSEQPLFKIVEP